MASPATKNQAMQQARMFITNSMKANGTNLDDFIKLGAFAESSLKRRINYSHVVKAAILMGIAKIGRAHV